MAKGGWHRESARHSLAARGCRTNPRKSLKPSLVRGTTKDWDLWNDKIMALVDLDDAADKLEAWGKLEKELDHHMERWAGSEPEIEAVIEVRQFMLDEKMELTRKYQEAQKAYDKLLR